MAVRVVYDGVACAGKTTNVRQLCTLFIAQQKSDVETPAEMSGRTLYFDWLSIMAGQVCGFPLLCQVVSVPGQVVLTPRRQHLLGSADVVVYVCESHPAGIEAAKAGLALYDRIAAERGIAIPLVIQANKQDQRGALDSADLLKALGREGTPVIEAIASEGVGVVDTFVAAVRAVARSIEKRSEENALRVAVRRAERPSDVLAQLEKQLVDPEWAAELLLEEAQAALLLSQAKAALAADADARAGAARAVEEIANATEIVVAPESAVRIAASDDRPVLPSPDVPTGFIWPAHTGRATVRVLGLGEESELRERDDGTILHVDNGHVVRTSPRARYADTEAARQALVRAARESIQLDRLLVPETVLVAQTAHDGACWIWTVRPDVPSFERLLEQRLATPELLAAYGAAVVEALRTSLRHGFGVELGPRHFGVQSGVVRYLGELLAAASLASELSTSVVKAASAIERARADSNAFVTAFERELGKHLTAEERAVYSTTEGAR